MAIVLSVQIVGHTQAAVPSSESLLPASTVAYLSVANPADLEQRFDRTQLGQFAQDPSLEPFVEQVRDSITEKMGDFRERIGITMDDLRGVAGGELAWSIVAREKGTAGSVLLVDTTGNAAARDALIKKIDSYLADRKATKDSVQASGQTITSYTVPAQNADDKTRYAAYFVAGDLLCVTDQLAVAEQLASRLGGTAPNPLKSLPEYAAVMSNCKDSGDFSDGHVRWFIQPFKLVDAIRTIRPRTREGEDRMAQFREQGFDAIQGIGGLIKVSPDAKRDFIHRTFIYAPAATGTEAGEKYRLAMNMFKTPNSSDMQLHNWTPRMIARYTTLNIDLLNAFDHFGTLFDSMIAGYPDAFETAMDRFKNDPFGPGIDFRNEIIASLGTRICAMTDYTLPIDTTSERFLVAIEVKPNKMATLQAAIAKYLEKDGYIKKELEGHDIWEFQPQEEEDFDIGLDGGLLDEPQEEEEQRLLTRSAVCASDGQLFIASDVEFLRLAFKQATENEALAESFDYQAVQAALENLAGGPQCSWTFTRTDEAMRPTYALLRENRLPQSESFFARMLNELLTPPEDQKNQLLREQKLDGSKLPSFELARRYFGPSGRTVRAEVDGWLMTGVLLNKAEN
ncbi:DUF3352 domain-containing protein [Aeoliella mucimassa]|uniref:DUF3352 domain-containing protein n=1 Tax=Aeoliella mucimassa TaxID=2527972 RepID=UPI0018D3972A|nr:DUF3352 domain-containing protein [Aeoliella mucimassa]